MATIKNNDIAKAIYLSTKGKSGADLKATLENVVKFLVRRRLLSRQKDILQFLESVINKESGIVTAEVSSKEKISHKAKEEIKHSLKKRYSAKEVVIEEKLDAGLLGGVRIEVNNEVMDLSLKNKIGQLQEHLSVI